MKHLIIGNKNYSSWSLRPWLLMKEKGISFKETKIPLYIEERKEELVIPSLESWIAEGINEKEHLEECEVN